MNRDISIPRMRDYARQLLAYEASEADPNEPVLLVMIRVLESLRRSISTLAGVSGFSMLLSRALTLTKAQVPGLNDVKIKPDGSLDEIHELACSANSEASVMLIAQLLGLLVTLIGEGLVHNILVRIWPDFTMIEPGQAGESEHDSAS